MKIFGTDDGWDGKINFVDENNVVLGYDMGQSCCEYADWFISDTLNPDWSDYTPPASVEFDKEPWVFDPAFHEDVSPKNYDFDGGGCVAFRIVNGEEEKFIHIFNSHNGYYSHGFTFTNDETEVESGSL